MLHVSLFSGQGGFDLASEWMGWKNILSCEINPFCRRILKYYWPNAYHHDDVKTLTFNKINHELTERFGTDWRNDRIILTGGFPCQPFSHAGQRNGAEDDRYLWPEARRVIKELQPSVLVLENVPGLFTILQPDSLSEMETKEVSLFCEDENHTVTTTIERIQRRIIGLIIEEIRAEGYSFPEHSDGTPILLCVPACATGAPHRRDRIWFVAYRTGTSADTESSRWHSEAQQEHGTEEMGEQRRCRPDHSFDDGAATTPTNPESGERYAADQEQPVTVGGNPREDVGGSDRGFEPASSNPNSEGHRHINGLEQDRCQAGENQGYEDKREWNRPELGGSGSKDGLDSNAESNRWDSTPQQEHGTEEMGEQRRCRPDHSFDDGAATATSNTERFGQQGQGQPESSARSAQGGEWEANIPVSSSELPGTDTSSQGLQEWQGAYTGRTGKDSGNEFIGSDRGTWGEHWLEAATRLCNVDDGLPRKLDGITISSWRTESLKAAGNAIVPGVALEIFKAIEKTLKP